MSLPCVNVFGFMTPDWPSANCRGSAVALTRCRLQNNTVCFGMIIVLFK